MIGELLNPTQRKAVVAPPAPAFRLGQQVENQYGVVGRIVGVLDRFESFHDGQWILDTQQCYRVEFATGGRFWQDNVEESDLEVI